MINYIAIAVTTVVIMAIGSLWYSPLMFGKIWAAGIKFKGEPKMSSFHLVQAFGVALAIAVGLAYLLNSMNITDPVEAIKNIALLVLIFIATSHYNSVIWAQKPISVYLIDVSYCFTIFCLSSALLVGWN